MGAFFQLLLANWQRIAVGLSVATLGYFLLFFGMDTLVPQYSASEIAAQNSATSLTAIWNEPLNAPYKLLLWIPYKLGSESLLWGRAISAAIAVICGFTFYFLVRTRFSKRIILLTTLLFVVSAGFLHAGRLGTPLILQLYGVLTLFALMPIYMLIRGRAWPLYASTVVVASLMYVPGMIWFIAIGSLTMTRQIGKVYRKLAVWHLILLPLLAAALLTPLLWSFTRDSSSILTLLGLPHSLPTISAFGENTINLLKSLFWSGTGPAEIMLIGAPLLTIVEAALLVIGFWVLISKLELKSNLMTIGGIVFVCLLIIAGGGVTYITLTPLLYLCVASGLFYLFREWLRVFPVNPVANIVGTSLIVLLVASAVLFHVRSYFFAWPHSVSTAAAFSQAQPHSITEQKQP